MSAHLWALSTRSVRSQTTHTCKAITALRSIVLAAGIATGLSACDGGPETSTTVQQAADETAKMNTPDEQSSAAADNTSTPDQAAGPGGRTIEVDPVTGEYIDPAGEVIYGEDNRIDIWEAPYVLGDQWESISKNVPAVMGVFANTDLNQTAASPDFKLLKSVTYQAAEGLCEDQKFARQPTGPYCTGFLVAPDIVTTAGHCIEDAPLSERCGPQYACLNNTYFVFGFAMQNEDPNLVVSSFSPEKVFTGVEILAHGSRLEEPLDFALVKLDRPVVGVAPVTLSAGNSFAEDQTFYVIGHPTGLPLKIATDGILHKDDNPNHFVASLDTFGGNSGSPIFNLHTHKVEGILVEGAQDFRKHEDKARGCNVAYTCKEICEGDACPSEFICSGEVSTRVNVFSSYLPQNE